jgi:hypothetical protein
MISLVQSIIGVSLGLLLGFVLIYFLNIYNVRLFENMTFHFQAGSIPILMLLPLAGGLTAGIFPIIKLYRSRAGDMINNYL